MDFHLDVSQIEALADDVANAGRAIPAKVELAHRASALGMEAYMKAIAPVRFGFLRDSISTEFKGSGSSTLTSETGPTVDYSRYLEDGTVKMAPRPYMRPAVDAWEGPYLAAIEAVLDGLVL